MSKILDSYLCFTVINPIRYILTKNALALSEQQNRFLKLEIQWSFHNLRKTTTATTIKWKQNKHVICLSAHYQSVLKEKFHIWLILVAQWSAIFPGLTWTGRVLVAT